LRIGLNPSLLQSLSKANVYIPPVKRLFRNQKKELSFPRQWESSFDFIQILEILDARFRGHDES